MVWNCGGECCRPCIVVITVDRCGLLWISVEEQSKPIFSSQETCTRVMLEVQKNVVV